MATISLPSDVIFNVLKFVPYENAIKLILTSKSWVKPLQFQLKEQQNAIIVEIRRLESSDLGEKKREIKSDYDRMVENEAELWRNFRTYINRTDSVLQLNAEMVLFNHRLQAIRAHIIDSDDQYYLIAKKRQPEIDKMKSLESKLDQCEKREIDLNCRFVDLELFGMIALFIGLQTIIALIIIIHIPCN